jgi:DASH complex subunit DAM1
MGGGALEELSDGMATLDTNMQHLQSVHENLSRFSESFSAFLYGIKMNAWCVEFSEAPSGESFQRDRTTVDERPKQEETTNTTEETKEADADTTYTTNDNQSFIVQPPKQTPKQRQSRIPSTSSSRTTSHQSSGIPTENYYLCGKGPSNGPRTC